MIQQTTLFDPPTQPVINMPAHIELPKYPAASVVIDKILNVKPNNKARLPADDLAEMKRLQAAFDEQNGKLDRWEMLIKFELENLYPGNWKVERTRYSTDLRITNDSDNPFSRHEYDPENALDKIFDHRDALKKAFYLEVLSYFRIKYDLPYFNDGDDDEASKNLYSYEPVIDFIFSKLEHGSLTDAATNAMIKKFYKLIYGKQSATLDKNKIQFPSIGFYRFENSNADFKNFFEVLGYFETGKVGQPLYGEVTVGDYKQSKTYQLGGEKITAVRFYQNGKAILYFNDEMNAHKFYNLF